MSVSSQHCVFFFKKYFRNLSLIEICIRNVSICTMSKKLLSIRKPIPSAEVKSSPISQHLSRVSIVPPLTARVPYLLAVAARYSHNVTEMLKIAAYVIVPYTNGNYDYSIRKCQIN